MQVNILLPPGTSLTKSSEIAATASARLLELDDVESLVQKTGRAELDEHAEGVHVTEIIAGIRHGTRRSREELIADISRTLDDIPGVLTSVEQPLSHLISHMLSGVKAQVAIKIYGDDQAILRRQAEEIEAQISGIEGVRHLQIEQQIQIPQLRIEADDRSLQTLGLRRAAVNEFVETAMKGEVVSQVLMGDMTFDLLVKMGESYRENLTALSRLAIDLPGGGSAKLEDVARIYRSDGPNTINREKLHRRIVVQCNVSGRGVVDVVEEIRQRAAAVENGLPPGYFVEYSGQFESQQSAARVITILFAASVLGMFLVLFTMFRSANLSLQVMVALPMAFIGAVTALVVTNQTFTIASQVGFISLCGIASRNGILLISHYLHLAQHEGESWSREMMVRAAKDRLAPVLMTALTSGLGMLPLAFAAGTAGKEILYPVATVIIGGLISSTLLEFFVRPALFWKFGLRAAARALDRLQAEPVLGEVGLNRNSGQDSLRPAASVGRAEHPTAVV